MGIGVAPFVGTLIVCRTAAGRRNPVHASLVVLHVNHDACIADGIARFIDDFAAEEGQRRETQHEVFGVELGTSHNCR